MPRTSARTPPHTQEDTRAFHISPPRAPEESVPEALSNKSTRKRLQWTTKKRADHLPACLLVCLPACLWPVARHPASQLANQQATQPVSWATTPITSQPDNQPTSHPANQPTSLAACLRTWLPAVRKACGKSLRSVAIHGSVGLAGGTPAHQPTP